MVHGSAVEFGGTERFEIRRRLGEGGMGVVYEAFDREHRVRCALKTLRQVDARALYRFKNEFRALHGIEHPNLVRLGELIEADGVWFFTMELIEGVSFSRYVRGEDGEGERSSSGELVAPSADTMRAFLATPAASAPQPPRYDERRLRDGLRQLALGLATLHRAGMVHRDIKPSNIRVTHDGRVVLLDFGLVAAAAGGDSSDDVVVGTAAYMAPEQAVAGKPGAAADWYSVGVVLYEALTGKLPFTGSAIKILMDKQRRMPPPPRAHVPEVPPDLDELCTALMHYSATTRPSARAVLEALGVDLDSAPAVEPTGSAFTQTPSFIGRDEELAAMRAAFEDSRAGRPVIVTVAGESGLGKSELVRHFTEELAATEGNAVVLTGRCFEQESVPYKAFDGIADALSRYMVRLSDRAAAELLPLRASLLPQLFPVLSRVEAIARAPREGAGMSDPQELRTQMFGALRELLCRIAQRHPLVLFIDDLQWADTDSLSLLAEVLHPPEPPGLLLIVTTRQRFAIDDPSNPLFGDAGAALDVRHLALEELSAEQAQRLVEAQAPRLATQHEVVDAIAREARGHPLFILELIRQVEVGGMPRSGTMRLEDALWSRIASLPLPARGLLELLAVAGSPISREVAAHATRYEPEEFEKAASLLRVMSMARSSGLRESDNIECYHDRVASAVLANLGEHQRFTSHRRLAIALERVGAARSDPHALVRHLEAARRPELAAQHAIEAGLRAAALLAFDRAATFFRKSLSLGEHRPENRRRILLQLGEALANGGRGAEAADAFLQAAEGADPATRLVCHQRAAEQLLLSGHIEQGLEATATLLSELDVRMPTTPRRALVSLIWHRVQLRVRGLRWREKLESEVPPRELVRLDAYKAVAHGLSMVDTIRGSDFQARSVLLALRVGESGRVGRALTMEAAIQSSQGSTERARRLLEHAREIAERRDDPYLRAFNMVVDGVISYFEGRFAVAAARCAEASDLYRDQPGTAWERSSAQLFRLLSVRLMGNIKDLRVLYSQYLRDALRRGDRYLETTVRRYCNVVWMADDDLDAARLNLSRASWMPHSEVFHLQHWYELEAEAELALYAGPVDCEQFRPTFAELHGSLLLRIQSVRTLSSWLNGRLALADCDLDGRGKHRAVVAKMARSLRREPSGYPAVWGLLLEAALRAREGDEDRTASALRDAIERADDLQMALCAAAARRRLGELIRGDEGAALVREANDWLAAEGIANPDRMMAVVAPGFERD